MYESWVEHHRGNTVFLVETEDRVIHTFKTAVDAVKEFPGSFDMTDSDAGECED